LLLDGSRADASAIAQEFPALRLIVYRTTGDPPASVEREGETLLVTPGDRGRNLLRLAFTGSHFEGYLPIRLGPEHRNDADASRIYTAYLKRVSSSNLLEQIARASGEPYAGTAKCISCHSGAGKTWKKSGHAHALLTLEREGHARDPDCVSCHVVGLQRTTGFRSRKATPQLADVGCESCHGAGAKHARKPSLALKRVAAETCVTCHTTENSPNFDFTTYWQKIKH
jgi:mono/diheme cytochrome c family protein